jgi:3-hydroxyacyl-CoA dehydrogenase/enoyl-CoA hydratase/3-hydroxybutyryl-CoA epimerase/enoyl-CoA isomerase
LKLGMIDEVVPRESLLPAASMLVRRGKRQSRTGVFLEGLGARIAEPMIRAQISGGLGDNIPRSNGRRKSLFRVAAAGNREISRARASGGSRTRPCSACRNQMRLFFLQEKAKKRVVHKETRDAAKRVEQAAVIGAGVMGSGIAQC